jgi:hypothetical protein
MQVSKMFNVISKSLFWGALIGAALSSYFAPKFIGWYFEPPVEIGVNCRPAVDWSLHKLQYAQLGGALIGAILGLSLVLGLRRKSKTDKPI